MEQFIRVLWLRNSRPLMQFELACEDEEPAWRVFRRVCDVLKALVNQEARREKGGA